ncbi:hypothetical protein A1O3_03964 [Capronia epimyces CBS 606.96]|uniref:Uncharacterized protein n=1 Tax=Capronia epimyces CBS 606.96 TaxID=1182542 RepID=W9Y2H7_9EURO|nr:uncharacterized protein A1O3_03964 [Capronia epimyces CBS 606.96]EXJ87007.1 hypothetical protein A1O3_03964 [Capronia epimyces CBS 606.96]
MALKAEQNWEGLAMQADEDVAALPAILPEESDEDLEKWRKIIHLYKAQHVVYDKDADQWAPKRAVKRSASEPAPGPSEGAPGSSSALPQTGTSRDIRRLPLAIQEQSFLAGNFRAEETPIVQGLVSSQRRGLRSDSTKPGALKRKHELLEDESDTMSKRQEVVDPRLDVATREDEGNAAINEALSAHAELAAVDPQKAGAILKRFKDDCKRGLGVYQHQQTKAAAKERRERATSERPA